MNNNEKIIAVLIDGENVSFRLVDEIFEEISLLGRVTHRRVYGDFSTPAMDGWNTVANDFALRQVTQRHSKSGKNSSDIVLVIDAMDILHAGRVDAICVVSNDNDFTRLAMRLAEGGLEVIGMGEEGKAGSSFVKACSTFKYIADKNNGPAAIVPAAGEPAIQESLTVKPPALTRKNVIAAIKNAIAGMDADPDGWVSIGSIGNVLHNRWPDFDPRSIQGIDVKTKQLSTFLKVLPDFEIIARDKQPYLRLKKN
ncbi:MAG: NYN domain-containing protein [Verrucomicrobiales bacterium]|jgi:uncharacterized LabA/DUF88 family protein|nr:NYN domain-containing protein [Verrucomicrobiales bacterium]